MFLLIFMTKFFKYKTNHHTIELNKNIQPSYDLIYS